MGPLASDLADGIVDLGCSSFPSHMDHDVDADKI